jgi:hypothetical protein
MGMGNYPCYADTVTVDFVKEICPDELNDFFVALATNDLSRADFANSCSRDTFEKEVEEMWIALVKAFQKATGGLELGMTFHEAENRGDELDGYTFTVDGVYIYSPAGEKYKDKIARKAWTVYG